MANELTFGWVTGKTLRAFVYISSTGAERDFGTGDNGIVMTEVAGAGLYDGFYLGSCATIAAGDFVIITDNTTGVTVGQGQYMPEVSSTAISADLTAIEATLAEISGLVGQHTYIINETITGGLQPTTL